MRFITKGIQLKNSYNLEIFIQVIRRVDAIQKSNDKWEVEQYQNQIISILTDVQKPKKKHRKKFLEILEAAGFLREKESDKSTEDVLSDLNFLVNYISAVMKLAPADVREKFNGQEIGLIETELKRQALLDYFEQWKIHNVKDYQDMVIRKIRQIPDNKPVNNMSGNGKKGEVISFQDWKNTIRDIQSGFMEENHYKDK